jgi:hypothetical protein
MVINALPSWAERRDELRAAVAVSAHVRYSHCSGERVLEVQDISGWGCKLHGQSFSNGDQIWLHFGGFSPVRGVVRWSKDRSAGVRFGQRLSRYAIEHLGRALSH